MIDTTPSATNQGDDAGRLAARIAELEQQLNRVRLSGALPEQRYRTLADAMPQLVWATDANGAHFYYNRRWYEYTGLSEAESLGYGFTNALHPDDHERTLVAWQRAWRQGESYEIEYRFRRHDGIYHWFIGRAQPVYDATGQIVEWVGTCTDIDEQKRLIEAQRFLAEASSLLSSSLDYEETLARIARLAVPRIADWCAVDILEPDGQLRRLAVAHIDPEKVALARELHDRYPFDPSAPTGVAQVLRSGQPEIIAEISEELIRAAITDQELLEIMLALGLRSSMVVPLTARERTFGAITLIAAESGRHFTEADLRLAGELAQRAGIAVDNAHLYRELYRFRTTLDQTRDCVFMFDPETLKFFYVNQGAINQVGYSADELLEMTPLDIKPEFDERRYREMIEPLIAGEQELHAFETVHRHKDGSLIPVEVVLQYIVPPGEQGRFITIVRDITERKRTEDAMRESEQRYRALADAMPQVVWTADPSGNVTYLNQRWYEYTGLGFEDSRERGWRSVLHPDDLERCAELWGRAIPAGEPYEIEVRWRRADGTYHWHLIRTHPVRDRSGALAYWVGTGTNIDDQKRTEAALRERGEELEQVAAALENRNRELDQFAYVTSHDLKAPLRGIANLAQWVEEDLGDLVTDEARGHLELLRGRVNRMEGLIDGILQYSRVGRATAIEQIDSRELVEEVVDLLAPPEGVTIEIEPNLPTLTTERLPLQQVFQNLIGNAIKHGGPAVRVQVSHRDLGYAHEFAVTDDGPGIAPQYHERIFGIFQTLASRDKVEGSGLGLALIKKIVEHRRGRVRLVSDEGQGATFFFTWPKEYRPR
jgi:PAS domain S-box-containing protein